MVIAWDWNIWGKKRGLDAPYPVLAHMLDTAAVASALLEQGPSQLRESLYRWCGTDETSAHLRAAFMAGAHDLGKVTRPFQDMTPGSRHAYRTQLCLRADLVAAGLAQESNNNPLRGKFGVACALGGHHGMFNEVGPAEFGGPDKAVGKLPDLADPALATQRAAHLQVLQTTIGADDMPNVASPEGLVVLAGLTVVSDWIASQEDFIGSVVSWPDWESVDLSSWYQGRLAQAMSHLTACGLGRAPRQPYRGFKGETGRVPSALQTSLEQHLTKSETPAGIVVVTAPMGVGKTEAAYCAARLMAPGDSGLFFALPTMATSDAMFDRLRCLVAPSMAGDLPAALAHSMAKLSGAYLGLPEAGTARSLPDADQVVRSSWLAGRHRALLAPLACGTIDQLLVAAVRSKFGFLRHFAMAGKVVVIDEAHNFTPYMQRLLETALAWLGAMHVPVVVLSATMPPAVPATLLKAWARGAGLDGWCDLGTGKVPYPGWAHLSLDGSLGTGDVPTEDTTLHLSYSALDWADDAALGSVLAGVLSPVEEAGSALVVCNTVGDAQRAYLALRDWAKVHKVELVCLHSRMRQRHRKALTSKIIGRFGPGGDRPPRAVVVATQVVEQSLDVDFDLVVSALAPIANMLQRAGRGHRHAGTHRPSSLSIPRLVVLVPVDPAGELKLPRSWCYVYPRAYMTRTWCLALAKGARSSLPVPAAVPGLMGDVYGDPSSGKATDPELNGQLDAEMAERFLAGLVSVPKPWALSQLAELTSGEDGVEVELATRLGTRDVPVLVCDIVDGQAVLPDGQPLPCELATPLGTGTAASRARAVARVLDETVPLRRTALTDALKEPTDRWRPNSWKDDGYLREVVIAPRSSNGTVVIGGCSYTLDDEIGWRQQR